jgi:glycosyltransferase involved in cell wall biosynthesis
MKIAILADGIPPEGKGGAERIAWQSAVMLAQAGHDVMVITTTQVGQGPARVGTYGAHKTLSKTVEGIQIFSIPSRYHTRWRAWVSLYNPRPVREVRRILGTFKPDIVHMHNVHQHLSYGVCKVARQSGARVLHTAHDVMAFHYGKLSSFVDPAHPQCAPSYEYKISPWQQLKEYRFRYNPFRNFYIRIALRHVDKILAVSRALQDALAQNGIRNTEVLYNGIDAKEWIVSEEAIKTFINDQELQDKKIILFGGRISGQKGAEALLAALPRIVERVPQTVVLFLGEKNEYIEKLKTSADAAGIGGCLRITGWISGETLRAAFHAADLVVAPSLYLDPLPTVVLEAMACAKPVVGSCFGGIPEMIQDTVTGYILHPLATEEFADRCVQVLKESELSKRLGSAGAKRQAELFSEKKHLKILERLYAEAMELPVLE